MDKLLFLLTFIFLSPFCFGQKKGLVFNDSNENGVYDITEKKISNIVITNGFDVVKTDRNGEFVIPENSKSRFISITTPSGFKNTTKYYKSIDSEDLEFGLIKGNESTGKFIQITDLHPSDYDPWTDNLQQYVKKEKVDFLIVTGDLKNSKEKGFYYTPTFVTEEKLGVRLFYMIGNHDLLKGDYGEQLYEKYFGPTYYSFDSGETHFIVTPMLYGDATPSYNFAQIISWMKKDIAMQPKGKPIIMFNHDNWLKDEECILKDKEEVLDLKTINLKALIHGHYHQHYMGQLDNGIKIYCSSTINMGGRHHCPAVYRKYSYDLGTDNDIQSETLFPDLENHLVANSYPEKGHIKIFASAYHARGSVKEMVVKYGNKKLPMKRNTNFSWEGVIPMTKEEITVSARFSDGNIINSFPNIIKNLNWQSNIGSNIYFTAPIIKNGIMYIASADDDACQTSGVYAYDAITGKKLWYYHTKSSVSNDIVYEDGTILACDTESNLYAINADDGRLKWKQRLRKVFRGMDMFKGGICAQNGIVYAGQLSYLMAIKISNGEILWKGENPGGETSISTHQIYNGNLHVTTSFGVRYALNIKTGKLVWKNKLNIDDPYNYNYTSALFYKDKMYFTNLYSLFEADPNTGEILRQIKTNYQFRCASAPVQKDGILYMGTANKGVVAYDIENMKELWNYQTSPSVFQTAPYLKKDNAGVDSNLSIVGDKLFFGACDGNLYCLDAKSGIFIWSQSLGSPILGDVQIYNKVLYTADYAGNLYSFDLSSIL